MVNACISLLTSLMQKADIVQPDLPYEVDVYYDARNRDDSRELTDGYN